MPVVHIFNPDDVDPYVARCEAAVTDQGLRPVLAAFADVPDLDAAWYQSGGFTMLIEVTPHVDKLDRVVWISDCSADDTSEPCYLLGLYTMESLEESTEGLAYVYGIVAGDLVTTARKLLTDGTDADIEGLEVT